MQRPLNLQDRYAGFERGKITNNEPQNPDLGYSTAYHGRHLGEATIYVYDLGQEDIPDGPTSRTILDEFNRATNDVLALPINGRRVELIDRYGTGAPDRGKEFLCAEFVLEDEVGRRRSFLYLTGADRHFVKIRVTLRSNDPADPTAREFADAVAFHLWD